MNFCRRSILPPTLALALIVASGSATADRLQWEPKAGAESYDGMLARDGKLYHVRTESNWILCPGVCAVELDAVGAGGRALGRVSAGESSVMHEARANSASKLPPTPGPAREPAPEPAPEPDSEPLPEPAPEPAPEPEPAPQPAAEPAPESESEPVAEPPPEPKSTPVADGEALRPSVVSLTLGLGKEYLDAEGGISAYAGETGIGGTILSATHLSVDSPLGYDFAIDAHNFGTETTEKDEGTGVETKRDSKFLRLAVRAGVFYDFLAPKDGVVGIGLALRYLKVPALEITNNTTGAGDLKAQNAVGPSLIVALGTSPFDAHQLVALLEYMPVSFGKSNKTKTTGAEIAWRYSFVPALATELAIAARSDTLTMVVDCPAVTHCRNESGSTARFAQARLGLAYRY